MLLHKGKSPSPIEIKKRKVQELPKSLTTLELSDEWFPTIYRDSCLLGNFLLDGELTAVVATSGAYGVVDVPCAAVGADSERGGYGLVVRSALEGSRLGLSSFRMCHFSVIVLL